MAFEVLRTPQARRVVEQDMDRATRASYEAAREELRGRGCLAGGYRMAAAGFARVKALAAASAWECHDLEACSATSRRLDDA
jgi:hypothetical protein